MVPRLSESASESVPGIGREPRSSHIKFHRQAEPECPAVARSPGPAEGRGHCAAAAAATFTVTGSHLVTRTAAGGPARSRHCHGIVGAARFRCGRGLGRPGPQATLSRLRRRRRRGPTDQWRRRRRIWARGGSADPSGTGGPPAGGCHGAAAQAAQPPDLSISPGTAAQPTRTPSWPGGGAGAARATDSVSQ